MALAEFLASYHFVPERQHRREGCVRGILALSIDRDQLRRAALHVLHEYIGITPVGLHRVRDLCVVWIQVARITSKGYVTTVVTDRDAHLLRSCVGTGIATGRFFTEARNGRAPRPPGVPVANEDVVSRKE